MLGKEQVSAFRRGQQRNRFFGFREFGGKEAQVIGRNTFEDTGDDTEAVGAGRHSLQRKCGFRFRKPLLHGANILEVLVAFRDRPRSSRDEVLGSTAQFFGGLAQQLEILARGAFRAASAGKFDAPVLSDSRAAPHEYQPNLARTFHVRPAAGLQIGGLYFDGAQDALAIDFFSHPEFRKFIRRAVADVHRTIFEDNLICGALGAFEKFHRRFRAAQINRADFGSEMEGNRGQAEAFLKHGRQKMLAGMLLHVVEAPRPVDAAVHFRICWTAVDDVNDFVARIADVENIGVANFP